MERHRLPQIRESVWEAGLMARNVFMRSANRGNANNVAYVNAVGNCNNNNASNGNRAAPDCVGWRTRGRHLVTEIR